MFFVFGIIAFFVGAWIADCLINNENKRAEYQKKKAEFDKEYNKKLKILQKQREEKKKNFEGQEVQMANKFEKFCQKVIYENRFALQTERKKYLIKNSYGKTIDMGWDSDEKLKGDKTTAIDYFWFNILEEELNNEFKKIDYPKTVFNSLGVEIRVDSCLDWGIKCFVTKKLNKVILNGISYKPVVIDWTVEEINKVCDEIQKKTSQFGDASFMNGVEYEEFCKSILEEAGWEVEDTPTSGDQGVDLIASIENLRVCIQCKCFAKAVGNKAVQEVAAGMTHWKGTHAVVVARNGFTKSARTLAESNKVILTSDSELENLENLVL